MAQARGLLFGGMDIPPELEDEFNHWYDTEHTPSRVGAVPGFRYGRRWRALEGAPKYAAVYELDSVAVLQSPEYLAVVAQDRDQPSHAYARIHPRWQNVGLAVYEEITLEPTDYRPPVEAKVLLATMLVPKPEHEEEFNAWYDTEHMPALLSVPGISTARRFRAVSGEPKYLALYDVAEHDVLRTPEYRKARASPWATRIRSRLVSRVRNVYERIFMASA